MGNRTFIFITITKHKVAEGGRKSCSFIYVFVKPLLTFTIFSTCKRQRFMDVISKKKLWLNEITVETVIVFIPKQTNLRK